MASSNEEMSDLEFHPVTMDRWADLTAFFEQHGKTNYCWCTRWRLKSTQFKQLTAAKLSSYTPADRYILFEFDVESAASTVYQGDQAIRQHWKINAE